MAKRKTNPALDIDETVLAHGLEVKGDVSVEGDIWVDGAIEGRVASRASVTIGPNGAVHGDIGGRHVTIQGRVNGDIVAEDSLVLDDSADVQGGCSATSLSVAPGATFNGTVTMSTPHGANDEPDDPPE